MTCYIVSGTQALGGQPNFINIMKMHNITKTQREEDDSEDDSEDEEEEEEPELNLLTMQHTGCVNRLRVSGPDENTVTVACLLLVLLLNTKIGSNIYMQQVHAHTHMYMNAYTCLYAHTHTCYELTV